MTTQHTASFGPRLAAHPTGALRAVLLVAAAPAIANARPLAGEPNAVASRATAEQEILAKTLRYFGCDVTLLDAHTADPYSSAVADAAIIFENGAVMMRQSAPGRRPESAWLEAEFVTRDIPIAGHVVSPGLLDGSDVLLVGSTAFVGASRRSNALGRSGFARIAGAHGLRVVEVPMAPDARPLRAIAGALSADSVVVAAHGLDHAVFADFKMVVLDRDDELGAGVLNLGEHHVLSDVRFPGAVNKLRKAGITVEAIDLYDFGRVGLTPSMLALDLKRA